MQYDLIYVQNITKNGIIDIENKSVIARIAGLEWVKWAMVVKRSKLHF